MDNISYISDLMPILLIFFIIVGIFGGALSKKYAEQKNNMYILEFNSFDKFFGYIPLLIILITLHDLFYTNTKQVNNELTFPASLFIVIVIIGVGILFLIYFMYTRVLFNNELIEIYYFWKPKEIILWKDVKKLTYADQNRQTIVIQTKNNKQYKISARLSGLTTFISQYKIRNKKNLK